MNVRIKNIGIVKDSNIELNGLTIITGKNNSGKSTVGKALYSVFYSLEDLYVNATKDICSYVKSKLTKVLRESALSNIIRLMGKDDFENESFSIWKELFNATMGSRYKNMTSIDEALEYIWRIKEDIECLDVKDIEVVYKKFNTANNEKFLTISNKLYEIKEETINELLQIIDFIEEHRDFSLYESVKILKTFNEEFSGQITPVKYKDNDSSSVLINTDNGQKVDVELRSFGKKIRVFNETILADINNVVLFDDSTVIDNMAYAKEDLFNFDDFFVRHDEFKESIFIEPHSHNLLKKLIKTNSVFDEIKNEEKVSVVNECISKAFDQDIEFDDNEYLCSEDKLNVCNLAMGTKSFVVIKQLLRNGYLNEKSLLILDEPETHLHPEWQNVFAEVIVLLVKELGVKVLLTSHSANFVLAIETYMLKYRITEKTNFYITQKHSDNYLVDYINTNDSLDKNYVDFANYFAEMRYLRNKIIHED